MLTDAHLTQLATLADAHDRTASWSDEALRIVEDAGVWGWVIPECYGGSPLDGVQRLRGYEDLAAGSLAVALVVTQQHGACELIVEGDNRDLCTRVLPQYVRGTRHCTLGISQLTTSTRAGPRQLAAERAGTDYVLTGRMPWSTAPKRCDDVVTGAVFEDGAQLLVCLPLDSPGVTVGEHMALMALESTWTTFIDCRETPVSAAQVVRGPAARVLDRRSTVKPLTVSAVGVGVARAILDHSRSLLDRYPPEFARTVERAAARFAVVRAALHDGAHQLERDPEGFDAAQVRVQVNDLVVRVALINQLLAKGTGYGRGHRAQRLTREALFFLVWSAPTGVQRSTLELMLEGWA